MKPIFDSPRLFALIFLSLVGVTSVPAQDVSIPDAGLNAAIRAALAKPAGPLTVQDLLTLTNLDARLRNVSNLAGLEFASNLVSLDLSQNVLTSFNLTSNFPKLAFLDLGFNGLTNISLPSGLTNLSRLVIRNNNSLTDLILPQGLTALAQLDLDQNLLGDVSLP